MAFADSTRVERLKWRALTAETVTLMVRRDKTAESAAVPLEPFLAHIDNGELKGVHVED